MCIKGVDRQPVQALVHGEDKGVLMMKGKMIFASLPRRGVEESSKS